MTNAERRTLAVVLGTFVLPLACASNRDDGGETAAAEMTQAREHLGPTDVTVLAPLPAPEHADTMLGAEEPLTGGGKLLPDFARPVIGQLVEHFTPQESLSALRVVCTRFDPCGPGAGAKGSCVGQIRLVLQPIHQVGSSLTVDDAAVHVFYDLGADATSHFAGTLAALPGAGDPAPLGVSPRLASDLRDGQAGTDTYTGRLRQIVRDLAGGGRLSRVTFLRNVDVKGNGWVFGGFDVRGQNLTPMNVPRTSATEQRVVANGFPGTLTFALSPPPTGKPALGGLLDPLPLLVAPDSATSDVRDGHAAAVSLENPREHDSTDIDCVSCHLAGSARDFAERFAREHGFGPLPAEPPSTNPARPASAPTAAEALRACGYVGASPVVSQRTRNETDLVVSRLGSGAR